jgi:hypothetical protein
MILRLKLKAALPERIDRRKGAKYNMYMCEETDLRTEALDALDEFWFVQSVQNVESTGTHFALRLHSAPEFVVQAFLGKQLETLFFALIKDEQRIFGIDREGNEWHFHPYGESDRHEPLPQGLEPKPLLRFLARVEQLIMEHNILTDDSGSL